MSEEKQGGRHTGSLYGAFTFGSVVLACYAGYFTTNYFYTSEVMVPWVFGLGALYTFLSVIGAHQLLGWGPWGKTVYFVSQCAILTAIGVTSPLRGFFGIIVLPLLSQAIFDYKARGALVIGAYLYLLDVAIWFVPFGWVGVTQAAFSYAAAFAFTVAFTVITKRAVDARTRAETLGHELEVANLQLRESARQTEELAITHERNRLAREIHDGVGHYLTVVKTQLDAAAALIDTDPSRARTAVEKAAKLTHEALEDVRRSVSTLRADAVRPPLTESLRNLAADAVPTPELHFLGDSRPLSAATEHALFRAAQEGLTNIRKHAQATTASLTLDYRQASRIRLVISDNGRAKPVAEAGCTAMNGSSGYGLRGLRERIEVIGGQLTAGRDAAGFTLAVEVPA